MGWIRVGGESAQFLDSRTSSCQKQSPALLLYCKLNYVWNENNLEGN